MSCSREANNWPISITVDLIVLITGPFGLLSAASPIRENECKKASEALGGSSAAESHSKDVSFTPDDWRAIRNEDVARLNAEKARS